MLGLHEVWRFGKIISIDVKRDNFVVRLHSRDESFGNVAGPITVAPWRVCRGGTKCVQVVVPLFASASKILVYFFLFF